MIEGKTVAVVVPCYNEETQIGVVIDTMPDFVDRIVVVNDCSKDRTAEIVRGYIAKDRVKTAVIPWLPTEIAPTFFNRADIVVQEMRKAEEPKYPPHAVENDNDTDRIVLINNIKNARVGGAILNGYKWCRDHGIDCTAVMAGDAQMDPSELYGICVPVVQEGIDYVKGNRLRHKASRLMVPKKRYFGNSVLSAMTKVASGYWTVSDTQTGYTAISLSALNAIDLFDIYRTYGVPNDILIKLNIARCTLREIPIKPVYAVGEQSKMKIGKVIPTVSWLLIKGFFKRIFKKYLINDFHPIFLFYLLGMLSSLVGLYFLIYVLYGLFANVAISTGTYLGFVSMFVASLVFIGFAMLFDVYDNEGLQR